MRPVGREEYHYGYMHERLRPDELERDACYRLRVITLAEERDYALEIDRFRLSQLAHRQDGSALFTGYSDYLSGDLELATLTAQGDIVFTSPGPRSGGGSGYILGESLGVEQDGQSLRATADVA